jgi:hypothetical protein
MASANDPVQRAEAVLLKAEKTMGGTRESQAMAGIGWALLAVAQELRVLAARRDFR